MGFDTIEMNLLRFIILLAVTEEGGPVEPSQCSCGVPNRVGGVDRIPWLMSTPGRYAWYG